VKEETSAHIFCECEALASFKLVYLGSCFLEPEDIKWKRKPQPTFFVSVRLWPHLNLCIWASFSWSQKTLRA